MCDKHIEKGLRVLTLKPKQSKNLGFSIPGHLATKFVHNLRTCMFNLLQLKRRVHMGHSIDKFFVTVGLLALLHAAYSAAQHRAYLRLNEQEFTTLPLDILLQTVIGLMLACLGIVRVVGQFREIRAIADMEHRTWDTITMHSSFCGFNHRGKKLFDEAKYADG